MIPADTIHARAPNDAANHRRWNITRTIPTTTSRKWLIENTNNEVRARRFRAAGIDQGAADRLNQPVALDNLGLVDRGPSAADGTSRDQGRRKGRPDPLRGRAGDSDVHHVLRDHDQRPQLLNSVIEEKMSKISEVLLGSITPFELMMGKLLGNTGIALVTGVALSRRRLRGRGVSRLRATSSPRGFSPAWASISSWRSCSTDRSTWPSARPATSSRTPNR